MAKTAFSSPREGPDQAPQAPGPPALLIACHTVNLHPSVVRDYHVGAYEVSIIHPGGHKIIVQRVNAMGRARVPDHIIWEAIQALDLPSENAVKGAERAGKDRYMLYLAGGKQVTYSKEHHALSNKELLKIAKNRKVKGYSKMTKAQLLTALQESKDTHMWRS